MSWIRSEGFAVSARSVGFPWGTNKPTKPQRLVFALVLSTAAAALQYFRRPGAQMFSDFSPVWYASKMLISGQNPYLLIGSHKLIDIPTELYYPVPAFVAVLPLTLVSYRIAGALFVAVSTLLLAWGVTAKSWHLLPMFASVAFINSARLGQWSILMTAAVFIPAVAVIAVAKPQVSLPTVAAANSRKTVIAAAAGFFALTAISFALFPGWLAPWWANIHKSAYFVPPITRLGGPFIALVLLRWRRREAWFVFSAACLPQTWYPYNGLLLLVVAATYREACFLSLLSSITWMLVFWFTTGEPRAPETQENWGRLLVATSYLPTVILILRRPNVGPPPWWLITAGNWIARGRQSAAAS